MPAIFSKWRAQRAGTQAGISWRHILDRTQQDAEQLTGHDLYEHARDEAGNWIQSTYGDDRAASIRHIDSPEQAYHTAYLSYVEAFIACFPQSYFHRSSQGYPIDEFE